MPSIREEIKLSTTKKQGMAMAVGMIVILSIIVFGSILYVGFTSVNTEIVVVDTMEDEGIRLGDYLMSEEVRYKGYRSDGEDTVECVRRGCFEYVPTQSPREPPVIRDPNPGVREDPVRPSEPITGLDWCGRCPPVIRNPRLGSYFEPVYKNIPIVSDPVLGNRVIE